MAHLYPHADVTYRILPLKDGAYGVEVAIPDRSPAMVTSFATEEAAQAWIAEHRRQAESGPTLPKQIKFTTTGQVDGIEAARAAPLARRLPA
jgi:hypothetical protein